MTVAQKLYAQMFFEDACCASKLTLPVNGRMKKFAVCKWVLFFSTLINLMYRNIVKIFLSFCVTTVRHYRKRKLPEVLPTTVEIPDDLQIVGRECLIHSRTWRYKKDLKLES